MKNITINGSLRKDLGKKSSKALRKENNVPCVIYGGKENIHFYSHENNFKKLIYSPDAFLVNLNIDNTEYSVVLKDIQFHPVSDKLVHIDFTQVFEEKPIIVSLPITVTGESAGIKAGGKLRIRKRHLIVKGLSKDIPEELPIDITELKIHQSVKVDDLAYDKIELLDPKKSMVLGIATSRVAQKGEGEGEGAEAEGGETAAAEAPAKE
jgi:large subunit ribosomal protein L25